MSDLTLISAEEARGLLDGIPDMKLVDHKGDVWRDDAGDLKYVGSFNYVYQGYKRLFMAAPSLAATVIALSEERDAYRDFAHRIAAIMAPPDAVDLAVKHLEFHGLDDLAEMVADTLGNLRYELAETREVASSEATTCGRVAIEKLEWKHRAEKAEADRDRLRAILACEQGVSAPAPWERNDIDPKREGIAWYRRWEADGGEAGDEDTEHTRVAWVRHDPDVSMTEWCWEIEAPFAGVFGGLVASAHGFPTALEAIEQADRAAGEVRGG